MLEELFNIANKLDCIGLVKEADYLDSVIEKYADYLDYSKETQRSLESSMNVDDMQKSDKRILELDALVEEKFDRGNFLQQRIDELSGGNDVSADTVKELEAYSEELKSLDAEVTGLFSELTRLSFDQGRIFSKLRELAGFEGSSGDDISIANDAKKLMEKMQSGTPQYNWGVSNIIGDPSERIQAEASKR
jgi:hypothetical protein